MIRIVADTSTLYTSLQAREAGFDVSPLTVTIDGRTYREFDEISSDEFVAIIKQLEKHGVGAGWRGYITHAADPEKADLVMAALKEAFPACHFEIHPLSPAFITQGGPSCMAVQIIEE